MQPQRPAASRHGPAQQHVLPPTLASLTVQTSLARDQKSTEMTTEPHSSEAQ